MLESPYFRKPRAARKTRRCSSCCDSSCAWRLSSWLPLFGQTKFSRELLIEQSIAQAGTGHRRKGDDGEDRREQRGEAHSGRLDRRLPLTCAERGVRPSTGTFGSGAWHHLQSTHCLMPLTTVGNGNPNSMEVSCRVLPKHFGLHACVAALV